MKNLKLFFWVWMLMAPLWAQSISGVILDASSNVPLSQVKVSLDSAQFTWSKKDGSYLLNTQNVGLLKGRVSSQIYWNTQHNQFNWTVDFVPVNIKVLSVNGKIVETKNRHDLNGKREYRYLPSSNGVFFLSIVTKDITSLFRMTKIGGYVNVSKVYPISAKPLPGATALTKRAAIYYLTFEKGNYVTVRKNLNGDQSGLNVEMNKIDTSSQSSRSSDLTWYTSYPDPSSEECIKYNGCQWAGYFAGINGQMSKEWVKANNIAAVHSRDFETYKNKTLRLSQNNHQIDVVVYDMCSDSDCDGCCTRNAATTGFLIDIESHTADRFGTRSGTVNWICLDCN